MADMPLAHFAMIVIALVVLTVIHFGVIEPIAADLLERGL